MDESSHSIGKVKVYIYGTSVSSKTIAYLIHWQVLYETAFPNLYSIIWDGLDAIKTCSIETHQGEVKGTGLIKWSLVHPPTNPKPLTLTMLLVANLANTK